MKLNMGCGHNKADGFVNVDKAPECAPDQVVDLEAFPWPWETASIDEVMFNHSLEHLGRDPDVFFMMMRELYRVCRHRARIAINVPHPRHDHFIGDPTHVRPVTPEVLTLFSKRLCRQWIERQCANSTLALYLDVDFELLEAQAVPDAAYVERVRDGSMTIEELTERAKTMNNVVVEFRMVMEAIKEVAQ